MNPITLHTPTTKPMRRAGPMALALAALALATACRDAAESPAAQPPPEWRYWKSAQPDYGMDFRVAYLSAREGWNGR